ncbi:MAG: class I SAM-dependent methyltransferase [Vicinamibacterales bacterium]
MKKSLFPEAVLKAIAQTLLPQTLFNRGKAAFLSREAQKLRRRCAAEPNIEEVVDAVLSSERFRPDQKKLEIVQLLRELRERQPRLICEIGGRIGGSLALFAQVAAPDARILSIDLEYRAGQAEGLSGFASADQTITCVAADSHAESTLRMVNDWLGGQSLDFLFIDGDHTLEGARRDFEMYSALVKAGGIIGFHDIVPDSTMRTGVKTSSYVGGVPILWQQLKTEATDTDEFVENWQQDGFGIGVIRWKARS